LLLSLGWQVVALQEILILYFGVNFLSPRVRAFLRYFLDIAVGMLVIYIVTGLIVTDFMKQRPS